MSQEKKTKNRVDVWQPCADLGAWAGNDCLSGVEGYTLSTNDSDYFAHDAGDGSGQWMMLVGNAEHFGTLEELRRVVYELDEDEAELEQLELAGRMLDRAVRICKDDGRSAVMLEARTLVEEVLQVDGIRAICLLDACDRMRLARTFSRHLERAIGREAFSSLVYNMSPVGEGCDSHDFCDANEVMIAAFAEVMGREPETTEDPDLALINNAWALARACYFFNSFGK